MAYDLAFVGKSNVDQAELALLEELGRELARLNIPLHTNTNSKAGLAVFEANRKAGGTPKAHTRGLHKVSPVLLVFGDQDLIDKILVRLPGDLDTSRWHTAMTLEELKQVVDDLKSFQHGNRKSDTDTPDRDAALVPSGSGS